jgi:hypothetical protein
MRRANEELHGTLVKARKEVQSTRRQLGQVVTKQQGKSKIAMERLKVREYLLLLYMDSLLTFLSLQGKCARELEIVLGEQRVARERELNKVRQCDSVNQMLNLTLHLTLTLSL